MFAYRATSFLGDVFTNVSHKAVNNFEARGAAKKGTMLTVLNGIDINKFYFSYERRSAARVPLQTNKKLILSVGRFHKAKDYPNLLHAFSLICNERSDVELWIVGDGDLKKDIEQLIFKLNLTGYVKLLGIRNDIPDLMNASDVYALSSAWEGFGLVVAEAMATERVVVATDCGGVKEVIGECGFLVPTEDPELFAISLKKALNLEVEERQKLGVMARLRVKEKYSLRTVAKKWLAVYSNINV
ncbi:hypothetical protein PLIP_a3187 [Pseudoalteromonas lipolytica LMEB 39]|nr:hypothetical protein [Pseudoalteromonas lipolytica LMEB 39]